MTDPITALVAKWQEKGYLQHTAECELSWPVCRKAVSARHGFFWMKRVSGQIAHLREHVCGLAGFGHPGDICPACDLPPEPDREPTCSCGLADELDKVKHR